MVSTSNEIEMEDKKLSEFEDLADFFGFEEYSCGIWKSPYVEFKLDDSHVWRMRHRKTDDKAWILLRDGVIVAMAKREQHILASGSSKWHQHRRRSCRKLF